MKSYTFKIDRANDEIEINDLILTLGLYSDDVDLDYEPEKYIGVSMQISDELDMNELKNLTNRLRYRG